jgi:hypothetical protein
LDCDKQWNIAVEYFEKLLSGEEFVTVALEELYVGKQTLLI